MFSYWFGNGVKYFTYIRGEYTTSTSGNLSTITVIDAVSGTFRPVGGVVGEHFTVVVHDEFGLYPGTFKTVTSYQVSVSRHDLTMTGLLSMSVSPTSFVFSYSYSYRSYSYSRTTYVTTVTTSTITWTQTSSGNWVIITVTTIYSTYTTTVTDTVTYTHTYYITYYFTTYLPYYMGGTHSFQSPVRDPWVVMSMTDSYYRYSARDDLASIITWGWFLQFSREFWGRLYNNDLGLYIFNGNMVLYLSRTDATYLYYDPVLALVYRAPAHYDDLYKLMMTLYFYGTPLPDGGLIVLVGLPTNPTITTVSTTYVVAGEVLSLTYEVLGYEEAISFGAPYIETYPLQSPPKSLLFYMNYQTTSTTTTIAPTITRVYAGLKYSEFPVWWRTIGSDGIASPRQVTLPRAYLTPSEYPTCSITGTVPTYQTIGPVLTLTKGHDLAPWIICGETTVVTVARYNQEWVVYCTSS
ncbi:hypothetical protein [Pyrococcus kukulkanii]|uniref:hypothetical protein n=1 Tax=Pyrococcus kukulkanii TaxID=1609559 RepID=UPI003568D1AF